MVCEGFGMTVEGTCSWIRCNILLGAHYADMVFDVISQGGTKSSNSLFDGLALTWTKRHSTQNETQLPWYSEEGVGIITLQQLREHR